MDVWVCVRVRECVHMCGESLLKKAEASAVLRGQKCRWTVNEKEETGEEGMREGRGRVLHRNPAPAHVTGERLLPQENAQRTGKDSESDTARQWCLRAFLEPKLLQRKRRADDRYHGAPLQT